MLIPRVLSRAQPVRAVAPRQKQFKARRAVACTRHGWIRITPIVQYSSLLPPVGVWAVSQSQCGGPPSQGP